MYRLITIILFLFSVTALAVTVEEAGGPLGDNTPVPEFPQHKPSESSASELKGIGGGGITYPHYSATGVDFNPRTSGFIAGGSGSGKLTCEAGSTEQFVDHEVKLKDGDILTWLDVWGKDNNPADDFRMILYRSCLPKYISSSPYFEVLYAQDYAESGGNFLFSKRTNKGISNNETLCKIFMRVKFGTCAGDLELYKFRVEISRGDLIFQDNFQMY